MKKGILFSAMAVMVFMSAATMTAHAETANQLKTTIEAHTGESGGLSAMVSGNTVNVTGTLTGAASSLVLDIDAGVTVTWNAEYSGGIAGRLIDFTNTGTFNMTGGKIENTGSGTAIYNAAAGAITVSGGTVKANTGMAIDNSTTGKITISNTAVVTSAGMRTIDLNSGSSGVTILEITGGKVQNTSTSSSSRAIYNASAGAVNISGGTVQATTGVAIYNNGTGKITISGTAEVTSANTGSSSGTIYLHGGTTGVTILDIQGGKVENTVSGGIDYGGDIAIYNNGVGTVEVKGGTVQAIRGYAISNKNTGAIIVSGGTVKATSGNAIHNNTGAITVSNNGTVQSDIGVAILCNTSSTITVSGGVVFNKTASPVAIANSSGTTNVSGGFVFSYGTGTGNVISGSPNITGGGTVVAWDYGASGSNMPYTHGAKTNLVFGGANEATWHINGSDHGLLYGGGKFFKVDGVTVTGNTVPPTGLPDLAGMTAAMIALFAVSACLWAYVFIARRKFGRGWQ